MQREVNPIQVCRSNRNRRRLLYVSVLLTFLLEASLPSRAHVRHPIFLPSVLCSIHSSPRPRVPPSPRPRVSESPHLPIAQPLHPEYLWYEAENMLGLATDRRGEPILNPSWLNYPKAKAPGWGINGPGVSAEWSQGGESEWNSVAASADETRATLFQDVTIPRDGAYRVWARYADWANKSETFTMRLTQQGREVFRHEFGARDLVDTHD